MRPVSGAAASSARLRPYLTTHNTCRRRRDVRCPQQLGVGLEVDVVPPARRPRARRPTPAGRHRPQRQLERGPLLADLELRGCGRAFPRVFPELTLRND